MTTQKAVLWMDAVRQKTSAVSIAVKMANSAWMVNAANPRTFAVLPVAKKIRAVSKTNAVMRKGPAARLVVPVGLAALREVVAV